MRPRVLLADDESSVRLTLRKLIEELGCDVTPVADGKAALEALARGGYQLVVTDLRMPEADGMQVVRAAHEREPPVPVVVLTGYGTMQRAVEAMKLGAANFLTKPFVISEVEGVVRELLLLDPQRPRAEVGEAQGPLLVGESPAMQEVRKLIGQVAAAPDVTVLLLGESGTGKEIAAHLIHDRSARRRGPFIAVNCAAIPEQLLESELFGHARGSFTGATQARTGRFTLASGGTLFLDEIAEMATSLQAKVLRVLQDREVMPVGAQVASRVDVRIVAATNQDLPQLINKGQFREDLYYRLNVMPIRLPPLRERTEDIPALCQHFLQRSARRRGREPEPLGDVLDASALARLQFHDWPGNVRELENVMERVLVVRPPEKDGMPTFSGPLSGMDLPLFGAGVTVRASEPLRQRTSLHLGQFGKPQAASVRGPDLREEVSNLEKTLIRTALERFGGNKALAAEWLHLNRTTLIEKVKRLKVDDQEEDPSAPKILPSDPKKIPPEEPEE